MPFRFKQFSIEDSGCPMKVGTDSVLLGVWAGLENSSEILDIGTGCGLLALMAAQRSRANITAIDIDPAAIKSAEFNFSCSPWSNRLKAFCIGLNKYTENCPPASFDHIISNPPFFINSLKAPDTVRSNARHTDLLPFALLASSAAKLLTPKGRLSLVLPANESEIFKIIAKENGIYLVINMQIIPKQDKPANRFLMEFGLEDRMDSRCESLVIRGLSGEYTSDYKEFTKDFYLNF